MRLMRVKKGRSLHWPENFTSADDLYRGGEGYVVDLDAPHEAEWCAGMLHVLEPAPPDVKDATPIKQPRALRLIAAAKAAKAPAPAAAKAAEPKPVQPDLPSVDLPKKSAAKA
jgi:hypothetical protein